MKNKYWSCDDIIKVDAQYYMLLGPRGTGKSYAITKEVLTNAYNSSSYMFAYLRRYDLDIKNDNVTAYFADIDVESITCGDYNSVICKRGWIYFAKIDYEDEHSIEYSRKIGKSFALSSAEHYKSLKYPDVIDIIFEEFVTDSLYLQNEPSKLQELISSILRDRKGRVWLIGNTISRVSPYFDEWGLECTRDMEAGTITTIDVHGKDSKDNEYTTRIAVEICVADKQISGMFFGQRGKSINGVSVWTGDRHNKLQGSYRFDYEVLYEFEFREFKFSFVVQELMHKESGNLVLYIYPKTSNRVISRVITSEFSIDRLTSVYLYDNIKAETIIKRLFEQKKYCFSDDVTGDDFEHVFENRDGW